ncbi:hypothetical protein ES703_38126 [subsurface metagenome]
MKWQEEVEEILRKKFPDDDTSELAKKATKLLKMADSIDPPAGEMGKMVDTLMKCASKDLKPLAAVYLGFQLGVAWERFNAE